MCVDVTGLLSAEGKPRPLATSSERRTFLYHLPDGQVSNSGYRSSPVTCVDERLTLPTSYQQQSGAGGSAAGSLTSVPVSVSSFSGALLVLKCDKRPGMERVHLLRDDESPSPSKSWPAEDNNRGGILDALNK